MSEARKLSLVARKRSSAPPPQLPPDQDARDAALDVSRSWIVQAPAGAGKTELLTQRLLTLLAVVDEPEEILAITFTRAATAEMRGRVLKALEEVAALEASAREEEAASPQPSLPGFGPSRQTAVPGEPRTRTLARAALARSDALGWQLLHQPHRLDIQTIDSLCLRLAHGQPLLARLGGQLSPTEQAAPLYALAAQRTFSLLGSAASGSCPELEASLRHLLLLRDNHLGNCQRLIAGMLARREQWRHVFLLGEHASVDWERMRAQLEAPFAEHVGRVLAELRSALAAEPTLVAELLELAQYACSNGSKADLSLLHGLQVLPASHPDFLEHWTCLRHFLLVKEGTWRKSLSKDEGFPKDGLGARKADQAQYQKRMEQVLKRLSGEDRSDKLAGEHVRSLLCTVSILPAPRFDETQWETLLSVFRVLRRAVAELHVVFAERNEVDFAELSIAASNVLYDQTDTRGLLASESKKHLLIDEFQDTSRCQHQLIGRLLQEWQPGDERTCFLVGDPMQSIYIFRQAEVELFGRVQRRGIDCGSRAHPCSELTLSENFRSHAGLVEPLNQHFASIFAAGEDVRGEVPFTPSTARTPALRAEALQVHAFFRTTGGKVERDAVRRTETDRVVSIVQKELPRMAAAQAAAAGDPAGHYNLAILGRAKNHLAPIAKALRERDIPFRAIELETLAERQEILDLQSLLRALLHPADRIAWPSVLRAPWCGLTLGDLHALTGGDDSSLRHIMVPELIVQRQHLLTPDGQRRLGRVARVMERASGERFRQGYAHSLSSWLERAWTSLGAPAYLSAEERANAEVMLRLLDDLATDGVDKLLEESLARLCATPDVTVNDQFGVQLMTIHKAKGLGFDVVIVPALERATGRDEIPLIAMLERARQEPEAGEEVDELLVAPLGRTGESHRTYKWLQKERNQRAAGERKRLFYVACTRARLQLHLLGTAEITSQGKLKAGDPSSLLSSAWPALSFVFEEQQRLLATEQKPGYLDKLAASAKPSAGEQDPLVLTRVPSDFVPHIPLQNLNVTATGTNLGSQKTAPRVTAEKGALRRPEGSFEQRARGNAVHAMLEFVSEAWRGEAGASGPLEPRLARIAHTVLRRAGLAPTRVEALAATLVGIVVAAASHREGRWVLGPHAQAQSEASWSHWTECKAGPASTQTLRVDRSFRAGPEPLTEGFDCLWIIDYKTGAGPGGIAVDAYLEAQKQQWRPQLESYGAALRAFHGDSVQLRYGLYFPELLQLKTWFA